MRHVAQARRELGHRTIFNLLGPLANPAGAKRQLLGVFAPDFAAPVAEALRELGAERAWVLHGAGGVDELVSQDGNSIVEVRNGGLNPVTLAFHGHDDSGSPALRGGSAAENAEALRALLEGGSSNETYRQAVELNAAAALVVAGCGDLGQGTMLAREAFDSGEALIRLERMIAITQSAPEKTP
jgi:anthranilate phosphoribosyltransferase